MFKIVLALLLASFASCALAQEMNSATPGTETQVDLIFTGGHETMEEDRGRPIVLIAAALKVPGEIFRTAFKSVQPAPAGQPPTSSEVSRNKESLLAILGAYGVTNHRLDEVSNYYRYNRSRGEIWPNTPAKAYATVQYGVVTGITITDAGAGYSSPPLVSLPGMPKVNLKATLAFDTDFNRNGSVSEIKVSP